MLFGWLRRRFKCDKETVDHTEAKQAIQRAVEAKHDAEARWLDVAHVAARLDYIQARNGFGEDIKQAMRRKRSWPSTR
jgi:hypothetical protein